jgi:glutathionyl-hydroquinone reductase
MAVTTSGVASPVDFETYGDYAPPPGAYVQRGDIATLTYPIDDRVSDDGPTGFRTEPGRYHLYYSLYCPWAQRPLIALKLRGLDGGLGGGGGVVTSSAVDPVRDGRGWAFREGRGHAPDPVNGFTLLQQAYLATDPDFAGHISVPALWDREQGRLVSNHYVSMTTDLETEFREWADPSVDLYPDALRDDIEATNREIVGSLATATYAAMGATTQARYDEVVDRVYAALDRFERRLGEQRYLVGGQLTDADLLLYVQLVRFDTVAVPLGRLTRKRLVDHPNLWAYARDLFQRPAFRETTDLDHIARGTFGTGAGIRTHRIVPALPELDWDAPHGRDGLG